MKANFIQWGLTLALATLLGACGGGNGSSDGRADTDALHTDDHGTVGTRLADGDDRRKGGPHDS